MKDEEKDVCKCREQMACRLLPGNAQEATGLPRKNLVGHDKG